MRFSSLRGSGLVFVLIVATIATIIFSGVISYVVSHLQYGLFVASREQSLQVAEAGAHFYRWYIAHELDGKNTEQINEFWQSTSPAPLGVDSDYEGDFQGLGRYRITVTPPAANSTLFTLESTGWTYKYPSHTRTIRVRFRRPSWSEYMILGNDPFRLSSTTEIFGPMHGNGGIRFDGVAHNVVTAGVTCYDDPDTGTVNSCERPGVWSGDWSGSDPYNSTLGNPVFLGGKTFPVTTIDFNSVTADFSYMKDVAQNSGPDAHYYGPSGQYGYLVEFKPTGYEITKVKTINSSRNTITKLDNSSKVSSNYPSKGLTFVEDTVWFDGKGVSGSVAGEQFDAERMTLVAADLAYGTDPNLYIISGTKYKNGGSGTEAIGFIAEGSIDFPYNSDDNLTINGALLAQKGAVSRANYGNAKDKIIIFGAIASKGRISFGYTNGTGYQDRELHFDENLSVSPPPYFPTGKQYLIDLWEEL